jgi:hypothetical protein
MNGDRAAATLIEAIAALLGRAEEAHGAYEASELGGAYDQAWPQWYASYAVEHGIGALIGHQVTTDQLAGVLASGFAEFERIEPAPAEPWAVHLARRIAAEMGGSSR